MSDLSPADVLRKLGQRGILTIAAASADFGELECKMDDCLCPEGPGYFEARPEPVSNWAPSVDHKKPRQDGGQLTLENARLAHVICNRVDFNRRHGIKVDKDLAWVAAWRRSERSPPDEGMTLGELWEELEGFEAELRQRGLRDNTVRTYVDRTSLFLRWLGGDYQPEGPR
jgi:hypothetical protein